MARVRDDREYFEAILAELHGVEGWMIAGPTGPRQDFEKSAEVGHAEQLAKKLVGVETMDQPHDGELLRHARKRPRPSCCCSRGASRRSRRPSRSTSKRTRSPGRRPFRKQDLRR